MFESQRENDCVTKYIIDEFEDSTAQQYAIGMNGYKNNFARIREPVKKNVENSTLEGGPDRVIFHFFFQKKVVFKMHFSHFKPF